MSAVVVALPFKADFTGDVINLGLISVPCVRAVRSIHMFNPTLIVIEAFIRELRTMYDRTYGTMEPGYPGVISFVAQLALENIATSDAAYHDVNHTVMVTLVGQEILRGRHISVGGVTPRDWLHFIISLLCHDIGYVRWLEIERPYRKEPQTHQ
jgi:hypothetical protein